MGWREQAKDWRQEVASERKALKQDEDGGSRPKVLDAAERVLGEARRKLDGPGVLGIAQECNPALHGAVTDGIERSRLEAGALDRLEAALREAGAAATEDEARGLLERGLLRLFEVRHESALAGWADPQPEVLLWRPEAPQAGVPQGGILQRGQVAVLGGEGAVGKSTLALQWAAAAAVADAAGLPFAASGGLTARRGRWSVLSWEDDRRTVAHRLGAVAELPVLRKLARDLPADLGPEGEERQSGGRVALGERVALSCLRGWPLHGVQAGRHQLDRPDRLEAWEPVWGQVAEHRPDVVLLDPAASAYVGSENSVPFVRLFLDELYERAVSMRCGILLLAHSTKSGRGRGKDAGDEAGRIAGSAAWTDAARGALWMGRPERPDQCGSGSPEERDWFRKRVLTCEKANHASRFSAHLSEQWTLPGREQAQRFLGFEEAEGGCGPAADRGQPRPKELDEHGATEEEHPF